MNAPHLVTEAALDSEAGVAINKVALLAALAVQQTTFDQQIALAIKTINAA